MEQMVTGNIETCKLAKYRKYRLETEFVVVSGIFMSLLCCFAWGKCVALNTVVTLCGCLICRHGTLKRHLDKYLVY